MNWGIGDLQSPALPLGYGARLSKQKHVFVLLETGNTKGCMPKNGAGNEIRTRYLHLGKVALCQMSYARIFYTPMDAYASIGDGASGRN